MRLYVAIVFSFLVFGYVVNAHAQNPPAVPVVSVEAEELIETPVTKIIEEDKQEPVQKKALPKKKSSAPSSKQIPDLNDKHLMVLELFSTQACTFCPKADAMMKHLIGRKNLITLSCHIDYFDVKEGSLSQPICSTRQAAYETSLDGGPKYTPQMVMNGRYDAIGYLLNEVEDAFARAELEPPHPLKIKKDNERVYTLTLPDIELGEYKIWLLVFDKPHTLNVADGANRGKEATYYNVVSNAGYLGPWNGAAKSLQFYPRMGEMAKGFAVLAHDAKTNHIVAAAKYIK